jgi:hypothetical protein
MEEEAKRSALRNDLRIVHADQADLTAEEVERRKDVVRILRSFPHELTDEQRALAAAIRASFHDAADYVALLGTRTPCGWVLGRIRLLSGRRLALFEEGGRQRVLSIRPAAANVLMGAYSEFWLGRARTDGAGLAVGPVDRLEPLSA